MPKYVFKCNSCGRSTTKFTSISTKTIDCECGLDADRQLPNISGQQVSEVIDDYTGAKKINNQDEVLQDRRDQHYWEVEVPRLVQTMSTETCLEMGWLVYNEKGELVLGKAPKKR